MIERLLRRWFEHRDIGWKEHGEEFTRFWILRHPFGTVFLHRLYAPQYQPECHDHPWSFVTVILKGGYWETTAERTVWRKAGSVLYREAAFAHSVMTRGVSWSLVFTSRQSRQWGFLRCGETT